MPRSSHYESPIDDGMPCEGSVGCAGWKHSFSGRWFPKCRGTVRWPALESELTIETGGPLARAQRPPADLRILLSFGFTATKPPPRSRPRCAVEPSPHTHPHDGPNPVPLRSSLRDERRYLVKLGTPGGAVCRLRNPQAEPGCKAMAARRSRPSGRSAPLAPPGLCVERGRVRCRPVARRALTFRLPPGADQTTAATRNDFRRNFFLFSPRRLPSRIFFPKALRRRVFASRAGG